MPAFVPLSILPEPAGQKVSPPSPEPAAGGTEVMTVEVGSGMVLRIAGDVAVERAGALVQAMQGALRLSPASDYRF